MASPWALALSEREQDVLAVRQALDGRGCSCDVGQSIHRGKGLVEQSGRMVTRTLLPGSKLWLGQLDPPRPLLGHEALLLQGFPMHEAPPEFLAS
eukprot:1310868-Alexandrium_andersonii.AAC.1